MAYAGPTATGLLTATAATAATALPSTLAFTGFNVAAWILGAIGMIIVGFVLIRTAVFRRKLAPTAAGNTTSPIAESS